jgi:hypothetical protein
MRSPTLQTQQEVHMLTPSAAERTYVTGLVRVVVGGIAPEEIDLFDELIAEPPVAPQDRASEREHDNPLAFGTGDLVVAITPIAAAMVSVVLTYVGTELLKLAGDQVIDQVKRRAPRLFGGDGAPPALRQEQLELIWRRAYQEALAFGVEPAVAKRMARALIGALALPHQ